MRSKKSERTNLENYVNDIFKFYGYKEVDIRKANVYVKTLRPVEKYIDADVLDNMFATERELPTAKEVALYCCGCDYDTVANYLRGLNYMKVMGKSYCFENKAAAYCIRKFCNVRVKDEIGVNAYDKYQLEPFVKFSLGSVLKSFYDDVVAKGKLEELDYYGKEPNYDSVGAYILEYETEKYIDVPDPNREKEEEDE